MSEVPSAAIDDLPRVEVKRQIEREVTASNVTVIDVAPGVSATTIASLVRLHDGERIVTVGEHPVDNDLAAGTQMAEGVRHGDQVLDLTVSGVGTGVRRVLVVRH